MTILAQVCVGVPRCVAAPSRLQLAPSLACIARKAKRMLTGGFPPHRTASYAAWRMSTANATKSSRTKRHRRFSGKTGANGNSPARAAGQVRLAEDTAPIPGARSRRPLQGRPPARHPRRTSQGRAPGAISGTQRRPTRHRADAQGRQLSIVSCRSARAAGRTSSAHSDRRGCKHIRTARRDAAESGGRTDSTPQLMSVGRSCHAIGGCSPIEPLRGRSVWRASSTLTNSASGLPRRRAERPPRPNRSPGHKTASTTYAAAHIGWLTIHRTMCRASGGAANEADATPARQESGHCRSALWARRAQHQASGATMSDIQLERK